MRKEVYCVVFGNVQGVSFRKFAQEKAAEFGITGYAKNMEDGTVEVIGQGEEETLKKFVEVISAGPESAEVESMNVMWGKVEEEYTKFDQL